MNWQDEMITLFLFIHKHFRSSLAWHCARMANYSDLSFTDEEVMTIFIFGIMNKQRTIKEIYNHANNYMREWFPKLPGYAAFSHRINKLPDAFIPLIEKLQLLIPESFSQDLHRVIDSMPIVMAQNNRRFNAKVAPELADKGGYCSAKNLYYYGVKLHLIGSYEVGSMPIPEYIGLTAAGVSDRKAYEQISQELPKMNLFADKAYQKGTNPLFSEGQLQIFTPVKKAKGQEFLDAADQLLSTAVSKIRQPIESLNNWIQEKTSIQTASKVRSSNGLLVHVFGRLATAMYMLVQKLMSF